MDSGRNSPEAIVAAVEKMVLEMLPKRASSLTLAMAVGVTVAELNWAFRIVRGAPIYTALLWLRLDVADHMLRSEALPSAELVATRCGFGHYGVFHRSYRLRFEREPGHPIGDAVASGAPAQDTKELDS